MAEPDTTVPDPNQEPLAPASPPSDPARDNTTQPADADALKTQLQKLEMERNMLRKQKDALEKAQADRDRKELEEKEDYRSLAERNQAELDALRKEREERENQASREDATNEVFKGFDNKVVEVARTAGLSVTDDTEESKEALKTRLTAIQEKLGVSSPKITGSNPAPTSEPAFDPVRTGKMMRVDDRTLREPAIREAIGRHPQVQAFREFGKKSNNVAAQPL